MALLPTTTASLVNSVAVGYSENTTSLTALPAREYALPSSSYAFHSIVGLEFWKTVIPRFSFLRRTASLLLDESGPESDEDDDALDADDADDGLDAEESDEESELALVALVAVEADESLDEELELSSATPDEDDELSDESLDDELDSELGPSELSLDDELLELELALDTSERLESLDEDELELLDTELSEDEELESSSAAAV